MRRTLTEQDLRRMRVPEKFWRCRWDAMRIVKGADQIKSYVRNLDEFAQRGVGMFLRGPNGIGKSGVAVMTLMESRRRGMTGLFITADELRTAHMERTRFDDHMTLVERAQTVDALVLDDLGKEYQARDPDYVQRTFDNFLRRRSDGGGVTHITTNIPLGNLPDRYKPSMLELMSETVVDIPVEGPDLRATLSRQNRQLLEDE